MSLEKITIEGKRKRKLSGMTKLFSDLGFTKINLTKGKLIVQKTLGKTLEGKEELDYSIEFSDSKIIFSYSLFSKKQERSRRIDALSTFLNVLSLSADFYNLNPEPIIKTLTDLLKDMSKIMDKEGINLTQKTDELTRKNNQLKSKYDDLVISSEENARLLLEAERRNDELSKRLNKLEGMSDQSLKEELFKWVKIHGGYLDVSGFSRTYKVPSKRIEEGLNLLIKEGYIRKKG